MSKVLIIEDDQTVAKIYRDKLATAGYQVHVASDGQTGFEMVGKTRPDVILLDLVLPKISGVDVLKKIRSEPGLQKTPIIVFSSTYLTNMVQQAWKAGATKCLSKANCSTKDVLQVVQSVLEKSTQTDVAATPSSKPEISPESSPSPANGRTSPNRSTLVDSDAAFQAELMRSFVESLPGTLTTLHAQVQSLIKASDEMARAKQVHDLHRRIHALTGNASLAGARLIAQLADALGALLKELHDKPKDINTSTLRTIATAVDTLAVLFKRCAQSDKQEVPHPKILVVDDDEISRRAIIYALGKVKLKSINTDSADAAFHLIAENRFDLIFLDVDMPGMNGFELCTKLRGLPAHKKTPVVFVTKLDDLKSRASSMVSGGNDFIVKPFHFIELAVKALVHVLRGTVEHQK